MRLPAPNVGNGIVDFVGRIAYGLHLVDDHLAMRVLAFARMQGRRILGSAHDGVARRESGEGQSLHHILERTVGLESEKIPARLLAANAVLPVANRYFFEIRHGASFETIGACRPAT